MEFMAANERICVRCNVFLISFFLKKKKRMQYFGVSGEESTVELEWRLA